MNNNFNGSFFNELFLMIDPIKHILMNIFLDGILINFIKFVNVDIYLALENAFTCLQ